MNQSKKFKEPTFPKNVTIRAKDIKSWSYCTKCGKRWEGGLFDAFDFKNMEITEDSINIPLNKSPCTCENPEHHYYTGTEEYITGDISLPHVKARLEQNGVKFV